MSGALEALPSFCPWGEDGAPPGRLALLLVAARRGGGWVRAAFSNTAPPHGRPENGVTGPGRGSGARTVGCYLGQWPETGGRSCWRKRPGRPERPTGGLGTRWAAWREGLGVLDSPSVVGDGAVLQGDVHTGGAGPPGVLEELVEAFRRGGVEEPGDLLDGVFVDGCSDFVGQGWGTHVCVLLWRCCAGFTAATLLPAVR